MEEIVFACRPVEVSCLIGNLFTEIEPPCGCPPTAALTICGRTHSGNTGRLVIGKDYCLYYGLRSDLEAVRSGKCLERRCEHG